ncbi:MAG: hypothetical protein F9K40_16825 [Kofleriaceae bacterium]|nr:MAG: hypothetical protein F9K40_16825 [Kofleriaceae bacterium]MBZ0231481.1 hypothetical protein [Kofleriaceae bacterium]
MSVRRALCAIAIIAIVACKPVEGVQYSDPNRPEAQDWSQQPEGEGPTAQLRRELDHLRGFSGKSACYKGQGLRSAMYQLESGPAPQGDPGWGSGVDRIRRAVANVERAIDAECQGTVGPILSSELAELERALDAFER